MWNTDARINTAGRRWTTSRNWPNVKWSKQINSKYNTTHTHTSKLCYHWHEVHLFIYFYLFPCVCATCEWHWMSINGSACFRFGCLCNGQRVCYLLSKRKPEYLPSHHQYYLCVRWRAHPLSSKHNCKIDFLSLVVAVRPRLRLATMRGAENDENVWHDSHKRMRSMLSGKTNLRMMHRIDDRTLECGRDHWIEIMMLVKFLHSTNTSRWQREYTLFISLFCAGFFGVAKRKLPFIILTYFIYYLHYSFSLSLSLIYNSIMHALIHYMTRVRSPFNSLVISSTCAYTHIVQRTTMHSIAPLVYLASCLCFLKFHCVFSLNVSIVIYMHMYMFLVSIKWIVWYAFHRSTVSIAHAVDVASRDS